MNILLKHTKLLSLAAIVVALVYLLYNYDINQLYENQISFISSLIHKKTMSTRSKFTTMMTLSTVSPYQRTLAAVGTPSQTLQLISEGYTNDQISKSYEENDAGSTTQKEISESFTNKILESSTATAHEEISKSYDTKESYSNEILESYTTNEEISEIYNTKDSYTTNEEIPESYSIDEISKSFTNDEILTSYTNKEHFSTEINRFSTLTSVESSLEEEEGTLGVPKVLIVSQARSGSSFLGSIMSASPNCFYYYEPFKGIEYLNFNIGTTSIQTLNNIQRC